MPNEDRSLEGWTNAIKTSGNQTRNDENEWFEKHKPIKEFSIEREGELVHYGVWDFGDEDLIVMFKFPDGKYAFRNRLFYDKKLIKELWTLTLGD